MKKLFYLTNILIILVLFSVGCSNTSNEALKDPDTKTETPNTLPPSIMVDGELYVSTGEVIPIEPDESAIKNVSSAIKGTELPSNDGEINFPVPDAKYAKINDHEEYVVVIMDLEWVRFESNPSIDVPEIEQIIATLCSDEFEGRRTFSKGNDKAGEYIADIFAKIGLDPLSEDSFFHPYTKEDLNRVDYDSYETANNIVGHIKGKDSKKAIIISAHFDGRGIREGEIYRSAMDNASGVAALIKIAENLKRVSEENPFESNIIFCAFNGEEQLYIGSSAFVNQVKSQPWYENMYNINIDSIGAKDGGDVIFPNISEYSAELYENIKNSMKKNDIYLVEFQQTIASDHRSFEKAGMANICITQEDWVKWIHKPIDTPVILDYTRIEEIANGLSDFVKNNDGIVY